MTTRLDRLFLLLENGSTPVVRKSAAEQIGEVQKLHPHELNNLLSRLHAYLVSSIWETRIAAGQAVEAIVKHVPQWKPKLAVKKEDASPMPPCASSRLTVSQFDIEKVLKCASTLLSSEGAEYDTAEESNMDQREALARQKQLLNKRLGLDVAGGLGISTDEWFQEDDLMTTNEGTAPTKEQTAVTEIFQEQMRNTGAEMSNREKHRAKRKAKLMAKQVSRDSESKNSNGNGSDTEAPPSKLRKTSSIVVEQAGDQDKVLIDKVPDNTLNVEDMDEWPFEAFCDLLMNDLFESSWEKRHGAATGLREVVKYHGHGAGKMCGMSDDQLETENRQWLEDLALRLICVLALDRFGDFVSDEVVAPVRETCAQTVGMVLRCICQESVEGIVQVLKQLLNQEQWEVRHGGLLGMKYLLAIRKDMTRILLPAVIEPLFFGLQDPDDDVRSVAASALLPVIETTLDNSKQSLEIWEILKAKVPIIVDCLWHTLQDLDDLTSSTNSIMTLLATLLSHPKADQTSMNIAALIELVPRLWPFLRHTIASVRKASLQTLQILITQEYTKKSVDVWLMPLLQDAMRHIYQRSLFESEQSILSVVCEVWFALLEVSPLENINAAGLPWMGAWLCLMMQPAKLPFDSNLLLEAKHQTRENCRHRSRLSSASSESLQKEERKEYIGGSVTLNVPQLERDLRVMRARYFAAKLLGLLCRYICQSKTVIPPMTEMPTEALVKLVLFHLQSKSALQRLAVSLTISEWAACQKPCLCSHEVVAKIQTCLSESILFDEIALSFTRMQTSCRDFISGLAQKGVDLTETFPPSTVLSLEQALSLCTQCFDATKAMLKPKACQHMFEERRQLLLATVSQTSYEQQVLSVRVQSNLAGTLIMLEQLPEKLNPVIRPSMESLKKEENHELQQLTANYLARLLILCKDRTPCPTPKVIKNLCGMLCSDPAVTPVIGQESAHATNDGTPCDIVDKHSGIITLTSYQKVPHRDKKSSGSKKHGGTASDTPTISLSGEEDEASKQFILQRRGAKEALGSVARHCKEDLPEQMPTLWEAIIKSLDWKESEEQSEADAQELVHSLQLLESILPSLDEKLHEKITNRLPSLYESLQNSYTAVRHLAARCMGNLTQVSTAETMNYILEHVLPLLGASENNTQRQGSMEAIAHVIESLGMDVVPYIVLMIVPILGRMSDQDETVRQMATYCFAQLIKLMPLEASIQDPPSMKKSFVEKKVQERKFLEQLLDGSKIENYKVPVQINAELRKYQQDGINWLSFLNKYKLHGILCDDMGLGKTLQSLCILAGDHFTRDLNYKESKQADCAPMPSLVICPPTLTGHWVYEIEKFVSSEHLNPLHYTGVPTERVKLQKKAKNHNLIVASYDVVRNDIDFFGKLKFNYCILDEGHIIKNSKTKLSKAIKQVCCNHRLILSGTPIQNNVLELWSLFDFLMPGFLGTEKQFQARYGKPILQSRDAKSSPKEQEAGALAMEGLHRQVLPFLLRRMKEDVLKDLPPKIIQDYYCDLSPLQIQLYEDFAKSRAKKSVDDTVANVDSPKKKSVGTQATTHIFQALQYLRKVCNHPALVLTPKHPEYQRIIAQIKHQKSNIRDLQHAPKLLALKQLLLDCGIGTSGEEGPAVNQHRVLLFCQLKSMVDMVENDLLKMQMPSVTYLRLDGNVPAGSRHALVNRFNNDPSIDILLLTTHVGGLGLNLTGADTVIFVEHDWNPMKDLQAMDRAHRIGQKKVVNVYRLITRGTLEEKIMGLQKFKMNIANTVINQENSSLASMGTDQLLDLFALEDQQTSKLSSRGKSQKDGSHGMKAILDNLEELWDEKQYDNEYNLDNFLQALK